MRSASAQPNWSIARIAIQCAVSSRRPKRRSWARTASANAPPPGTTSSGWRAPQRAISSPSARSAPSPASRASPPPTLTTVSTRPRAGPPRARRAPPPGPPPRARPPPRLGGGPPRPPGRGRRGLGGRRRRRRVALLPAPRHLGPRPAEPVGDLAGEERADAERHDRRLVARPRARPPRRRLDRVHLLGVEVRGDGVDLLGRELLAVGAHEPRDPRSGMVDRGGPAVRRRARVGGGHEIAEDEVHVAADREQLRRDRARPAAHGHA